MLTLYLQTCSPAAPATSGEPAWTNPFVATIFGIYVQGDEGTKPVCFLNTGGTAVALAGTEVHCGKDEADVLTQFWSFIKGGPSQSFTTFNGRMFAVPFLYLRSAFRGVEIANPDMLRERYKVGLHVDVADALTFHGILPKPTLAQVAGLLGLSMPVLKEGENLQKLMVGALADPQPAMIELLARNGVEYVTLLGRIGKFWRKMLKPAF